MAERFSFVLNICERFEGKYYTMRQSRENTTGEQQVFYSEYKKQEFEICEYVIKTLNINFITFS